MDENQKNKPYGNSQVTLQDTSLGPGHRRPGPTEPISRKPSRKNTGTSEPPTPLPTDPHPYDYDKLRKGQAVYDHTGGVGNDQGEYWSDNRRGDRGASRVLLSESSPSPFLTSIKVLVSI